MRANRLKAGLFASVLLLAGGPAYAQQQVNLSAAPDTLTMPDGSAVPMWGYHCGPTVAGSTATCAKLNPTATGWSPVLITIPTGQDLQIQLGNNLSFGANTIPTSLVIVGQVGGGLGDASQRTTTPSPDHSNAQPLTWPIAGDSPGAGLTGVGKPPSQLDRVQSFATEVAAGTGKPLTWTGLRPGTYLIESGTHPSIQGPMGLYGVLVVTSAPSGGTPGTAYPGVSYDADVPLLLSEIDPVQNAEVNTAVNTAGFSETMVWSGQPPVQKCRLTPRTCATDADCANTCVNSACSGTGTVCALDSDCQTDTCALYQGCGNPSSSNYNQCYPPAVNYTPLYYMINGVAFDKTNASASLFPTSPASGAANVLVRLVNAGLRMHV